MNPTLAALLRSAPTALGVCVASLAFAGCADVLGYDEVSFNKDQGAVVVDWIPPDPESPAPTTPNKPLSCAKAGANCGTIDDGYGRKVSCGTCGVGETCGGGGPNRCGPKTCVPKTCAELHATCATVSDGCASMLNCGTCKAPETCGGAGVANQCGCKKATCATLGAECGPASDGCGGTLDCGTCSLGTCTANQCVCTPATCASLGAQCGSVGDGCGGTLDCGACTVEGEVCGSETPNKCSPIAHHELKTSPGATGGEEGGLIPVCCVPSAEEKKFIMRVFQLLNEHRQSKGLAPLTYDDKLESAIEGHCHHMAEHSFFDHGAPEGVVGDPWARAKACGTSAGGENIAAGQQSPEEVMHSWKTSPGHNANMLGNFKRVGIGFRKGGAWGTYWGQIFG